MELTVDFAAHASRDEKRLVISFLNALARSTVTPGSHATYRFGFVQETRLARAREGLSGWERDGLLRWRETG